MNPNESPLERRLRAQFGSLDTSAAFGPELSARIERLKGAVNERERRELRLRVDREWLSTEAELRRNLWRTLAITAVVGGAALLLAWLFGDEVARALSLGANHSHLLEYGSIGLLAAWILFAIRGVSLGGLSEATLG
jgi:hypothetical protein